MRRSPVSAAVFLLATMTAAALLAAATTITRPGLSVPPEPVGERLVRRFYETVNAAVRTGNASHFGELVRDDFVDYAASPGSPAGRVGLERLVATLHATAPDLRVVVTSVLASGDVVVAFVEVEGAPRGEFLGIQTAVPVPWGPIDTFRLADGRIAERRNDRGRETLAQPLAEAPLGILAPAATGVALTRLTLAPAARVGDLGLPGPVALYLEAGELAVQADGAIRSIRPVDADPAWPEARPDAAAEVRLRPGDAVALPAGVRHAIRNTGPTAAVVLSVATFLPPQGYHDHGQPPAPSPSLALYAPQAAAAPAAAFPTGVATRPLAAGVARIWSVRPASLAVGRLMLLPGAVVELPGGQSVLLHVEAGVLGVEAVPPNAADSPGDDTGAAGLATGPGMMAAGGGVFFEDGAGVVLRNVGEHALAIQAVAIRAVASPR